MEAGLAESKTLTIDSMERVESCWIWAVKADHGSARNTATMRLVATFVGYLVALGLMLVWHWSEGPPHTQSTFALLVGFGLFAALVGLASGLGAIAALHWTRRAAAIVAGISVLSLFWIPLFAWDRFLIWQVVVIFAVQVACLVVGIGVARVFGLTLRRDGTAALGGLRIDGPGSMQFSIRDFSILTLALAMLCAVLRTARPVDLGGGLYVILASGGACAAVLALVVFWATLGTAPVLARIAVFALVAPAGGIVYAVAGIWISTPLLFSGPWYAGVTIAQAVFMAFPCLLLRGRGYRFGRSAGHFAPSIAVRTEA